MLADPQRTPREQATAPAASVALFEQRARAVRPDFALTEHNAPMVGEICARLDGLPLAIELAAARMSVLRLEGVLARLEQRLPLLQSRIADAPECHRALRTTFSWS